MVSSGIVVFLKVNLIRHTQTVWRIFFSSQEHGKSEAVPECDIAGMDLGLVTPESERNEDELVVLLKDIHSLETDHSNDASAAMVAI